MRERYGEIAKNILLGLAITGAVAVAATSPYFLLNLTKEISKNRKYFKKEWDKRKLKKAFEKMRKNKLIILSEKNGKFIVELTEKGKRKVKEIQLDNLKIKRPPIWDKKWRMVIFDIPNKKNRAREALRLKLKELGFYQLQKSVWVIPYPCENEIQFLAELFNVVPFVNIIIADKITNDLKLKKYFKLL